MKKLCAKIRKDILFFKHMWMDVSFSIVPMRQIRYIWEIIHWICRAKNKEC